MKMQNGSFFLIGLLAAISLCFGLSTAGADDIAWDLVNSSDNNLTSFSTDAPAFNSPGDGFQKFTVVEQVCPPVPDPNLNDIPYALLDDTACLYITDLNGVIDSMSDFEEFFGVVDTENDDNSGPVHATWVFDISSGTGDMEFNFDLAAMGDFEDTDVFEWSYQIDGGAPTVFLAAVADLAGSLTYTMADGTTRDMDDPLVVDGVTLSNEFSSFSTPISVGTELTVVLTTVADGGSEAYVVRNMMVQGTTDNGQGGGGQPIPTLSGLAVVAMALLLMAGGLFLFRRLQ